MISYVAKLLLWLMGWKPLGREISKLINDHKYVICVFSHTSYYDFVMMVLYYMAYPVLKDLKTIIKPCYFGYIGWFLRSVGGIPGSEIRATLGVSTDVGEKNGGGGSLAIRATSGGVERIVNDIKKNDKCQLLISPKGTIMRGEWRTGYYHIAKALDASYIAIGMDYEEKQVKIGKLIRDDEEDIVKKKLYRDLGEIIPLYPEREMMQLRSFNQRDVSVVSMRRQIIFLLTMCGIGNMIYRSR